MEGLQGPGEEYGLDYEGNKKSIQVTEQGSGRRQVMFAKELI